MREQHQQGSQRNVFEPNKTNNRNNRSTCSSVATNATSFCVFADDDGSFTIDGKNRPPVSFGQATPSELTFAPRQSQVHPRRKFNPYHQSSAATQAAHALVASLHKRQEEAPGRDDADFCLFLDVINDTEKDATQTINNNNALTCQCKNGDGTIFWDGATVLLPSWISPDAAMDDDEEADRRKNFLPKSPFAAAAIAAPSNHARTAGALDSFPLPCGYVDHSNKKRYTRVEF